MRDEGIIYFLFLHLAASLLYLLSGYRRKNSIQVISESLLVLAIPFFGLLTMLGYRLLCYALHLEERCLQKEHPEEEQGLTGDLDYDGNIVPLNDTFLINAKKKREFFTTAIKQNVVTNQEILRMAMKDSDRETAYYAVSLLTTQMEGLEARLFEEEGILRQEREADDLGTLEEYAKTLKEYLSHEKFIDHVTFQEKKNVYLGVLDRLVSLLPDRKEYYMEEVRQLLAAGDYRGAEDVCRAFQERFPKDEDSYLLYIRLYQEKREPEKMQMKIAELKGCPIELSGEAMQVIRYWDRGARHG